jgi:hypothetical protein
MLPNSLLPGTYEYKLFTIVYKREKHDGSWGGSVTMHVRDWMLKLVVRIHEIATHHKIVKLHLRLKCTPFEVSHSEISSDYM